MRNSKYEVIPDNLIQVPLVRQTFDYDCGAAALQSVLGYYGYDIRLDELMDALETSDKYGTSYHKIIEYSEGLGCEVSVFTELSLDDLLALLDDGVPVIVAIQAWNEERLKKDIDYAEEWEDGHYVVVIGYDEDNLYFMDPSTLGAYPYIPKEEFLSRWHDVDEQGKEPEEVYNLAIVILDCPKTEPEGGRLE